MKVEIEIPKEFEKHFKENRFRDSLLRLESDAHLAAGSYAKELVTMLANAFENGNVKTMKFKVGDKARVKPWSQMFKEFGLDSGGLIDCKHGFTADMECYCGTIVTIEDIIEDDERYIMEEDCGMWDWSDDMLEEI